MLAIVALAGAVLLAQAPASRPTFDWEIPRVRATVEVPGTTDVNGLPIRLVALVSELKPEQLLAHVLARFRAHGLFVRDPRRMVHAWAEAQLTGYDPRREVAYTAIVRANRDGSSSIVLGVADLRAGRAAAAAEQAFPLPPSARHIVRSAHEGTRLVAFVSSDAPDVLSGHYRALLASAGWVERPPGQRFQRGSEELQLFASSAEGGGTRAAVSWRRADSTAAATPWPSTSPPAPLDTLPVGAR